jgi:hypothetical protein
MQRSPYVLIVTCTDTKLGICGRTSVRSCNFAKGKYEIGLEPSSENGWRGTGERNYS